MSFAFFDELTPGLRRELWCWMVELTQQRAEVSCMSRPQS